MIQRELRHLASRTVILIEDESDLLLFPPLRGSWSKRGIPTKVQLSGWNARRVIFGALNLRTGTRLFWTSRRNRSRDFQRFLEQIADHYRGWQVVLLLDEDPSHTAKQSQHLAKGLGLRLLWLPKRCPELNPLERLWGEGKKVVSADQQYASIEDQVQLMIEYLTQLSNQEALQQSGVLSERVWLKQLLSKDF